MASAVEPIEDLVGPRAARRAVLPDVVVRWSDRCVAAGVGVRSDRHGELRWERHARFQSGRAGNHLPEGWMAAAGPGIAAGVEAGCHAAADLTPTIFRWFGLAPPDRFVGQSIDEALARPGGEPR
jgi:arylsulfatase A-like enzyme